MPRFAANLSMMFTEVPFRQRFAAAARAGFTAVEFLFPYEFPAADVAKWLADNDLENVLFNLPPGDWAGGERGCASIPGREAELSRPSSGRSSMRTGSARPGCMRWLASCPRAGSTRHREAYVANLRAGAQRAHRRAARCSSSRSTRATSPASSSTRRPRRTRSVTRSARPTSRSRWTSITRRSSAATSP